MDAPQLVTYSDATAALRAEFAALREDVAQMRDLLDDAFAKLSSGLLDLGQSARSQGQSVVRTAHDVTLLHHTTDTFQRERSFKVLDERMMELEACAQQIEVQVSRTMIPLQFEDIVSQVCAHMEQRMQRIELLGDGVFTLGEEELAGGARAAAQSRLEAAIARYQEQLEAAAPKAVQQTTMDEGDTVLF